MGVDVFVLLTLLSLLYSFVHGLGRNHQIQETSTKFTYSIRNTSRKSGTSKAGSM